MLKLHAWYRRNDNGTWDATIESHPYIQVESAPCIDSARMMLNLHVEEELRERYKKRRYLWEITRESIL